MRYPAYLAAIRRLPCMCCGRVGATQAAHRNESKGMALKTDDRTAMSLCLDCHRDYDNGGTMDKDAARSWAVTMREHTKAALVARGEWRSEWDI